MWIFEHNFVADKAKIRRRAVARQVFFTQYAAKFAEKTLVYACEDGFSLLLNLQRFFHRVFTDVAPYPMPYLLYLILKIQKHFLLALSELRLLYLPYLHWYREFP